MILIVFEDRQHITAGGQLLLDGGHKARQLRFNLVAALRYLFLRLAGFLEIGQNGKHHDHQRQQRKYNQARDRQQKHGAGLDDGVSRVDLRRHVHTCRVQFPRYMRPFILVHADMLRKLDGPAEEQRIQRLHPLMLCLACRQQGLLG
ncbi:hypothetical protein SDC9_126053 [bioreactor metagenome]|uniref:Uncharacterized protein n=1 Tax=bioreactor metagenome TaxID=1076179 RepID=A0A645CQ50_9ZZZZ